ncbi:hypothetical protein OUZ56_013454 [Daphnia magna]|uniref:Uncharacterized protein n=1 Tax=Daphnia magna TaxID=35525 RepID=A0ABQ9Z5X7_9CRUS|nr:hypothetical protein OUZ56_013454 [Daphnia magna]
MAIVLYTAVQTHALINVGQLQTNTNNEHDISVALMKPSPVICERTNNHDDDLIHYVFGQAHLAATS